MRDNKILWDISPAEIEKKSFDIIESEIKDHPFSDKEWYVVRRIIHATANFEVARSIVFKNNPIDAIGTALKKKVIIFCDSRMIAAGISIDKLKKFNKGYTKASIVCKISSAQIKARA